MRRRYTPGLWSKRAVGGFSAVRRSASPVSGRKVCGVRSQRGQWPALRAKRPCHASGLQPARHLGERNHVQRERSDARVSNRDGPLRLHGERHALQLQRSAALRRRQLGAPAGLPCHESGLSRSERDMRVHQQRDSMRGRQHAAAVREQRLDGPGGLHAPERGLPRRQRHLRLHQQRDSMHEQRHAAAVREQRLDEPGVGLHGPESGLPRRQRDVRVHQ